MNKDLTGKALKLKQVLTPKLNRRIGNALADYSMLDAGDRVLVALSGGVDSMVLTWLLHNWRLKAPIDFSLHVITIENNFTLPEKVAETPTEKIRRQLDEMGIELSVIPGQPLSDKERRCFICAGNRRNQLFKLAEQEGFNKIALGHHKDDLVETLFINMLYGGNISTMLPRQDLFGGKVSLIRPLAYLEKSDVIKIATTVGIEPVDNLCPLSGNTKRDKVREILKDVYSLEPDAKSSIFSAMSNIRQDYLL